MKTTEELLAELHAEMAKPPRFEPKPVAPPPTEDEIKQRVADALEDIQREGTGIEYL
jgi:hypothetical protein